MKVDIYCTIFVVSAYWFGLCLAEPQDFNFGKYFSNVTNADGTYTVCQGKSKQEASCENYAGTRNRVLENVGNDYGTTLSTNDNYNIYNSYGIRELKIHFNGDGTARVCNSGKCRTERWPPADWNAFLAQERNNQGSSPSGEGFGTGNGGSTIFGEGSGSFGGSGGDSSGFRSNGDSSTSSSTSSSTMSSSSSRTTSSTDSESSRGTSNSGSGNDQNEDKNFNTTSDSGGSSLRLSNGKSGVTMGLALQVVGVLYAIYHM